MQETKQQQLIRLRESWNVFKGRMVKERLERKERLCKEQEDKKWTWLPPQTKRYPQIIGKGKRTIKKVLRKFRDSFDKIESPELKLAELISIANQFNQQVPNKRLRKMRNSFNRGKKSLLKFYGQGCATCSNKANVRHHIIPLNVGGINSPLNLILICHDCHEEIHPWMKQ